MNVNYSGFEFFCISVSYVCHYVSQQYYIVIRLDIHYVIYLLLKIIIVTLFVTIFTVFYGFLYGKRLVSEIVTQYHADCDKRDN